MCTSIVVNKKKTIVGWNLDILGMEYRVRTAEEGVFIEIHDDKEGWLPLFGANSRGDFIGMPTCHPYDRRSDPDDGCHNVMMLDIELLLQRRTLQEIKDIAEVLGHKRIETTEKYYISSTVENKKQVTEIFKKNIK